MIKFFRRIRRRLLLENKLSKYLVYGIGEIVLVVIGILIALQINNWNESQKLIQAEKETVISLKLEFQNNLISLEDDINAIKSIMNAGNLILEHTGPNYKNGSLKKVDSLIGMTPRMSVWDPSLYTLSSIKNSGRLATLSNEDLKLLLIQWEAFYSNLLDWGDFYVTRGNTYFDYLMEHSLNRNLDAPAPFTYSKSKFAGSNEQMLRTPQFENHLIHRVGMNGFMLRHYLDAKALILQIIAQCDKYE